MGNYKKSELIKLNIKQFIKERRSRRSYNKRYKLDKLIQKIPADNCGYEDLGPKSNIENGNEYLKALHWGLKNKNVKNIALTGPYGSGKSSIIYSYLNKYPSIKALNISLAAFNINEDDEDNNDYENIIELGILKQLFYKVDSEKIPQSRYRKIRKKHYKKYFMITTAIVFLITIAFAFFLPNEKEKLFKKIVKCGNYYGISDIISYLVTIFFVFVGIAIVSYILKWCFSRFRVKEVNIAEKATVEDGTEESSIFDKSMDEIVYFFEATEYNTVFIEDLDRFDSTKIFVKLRELNTILNNYDLIKRRIVFVYAIKDDMFENEERTKFFDFIIPVIPIINSTNSGEVLRDKLKIKKQDDGGVRSLLYDISSSYITLISPFIEDMRTLTSICNEFILYRNTLNSVKLKDEEMFSIIIFKNLYPMDFADLESEKGIIKKAFLDKREFINNKQKELNEKIKEYSYKINEIERDVLNSTKELKYVFINYLAGENTAINSINIDGKTYYYEDIIDDNFDMNIFKKSSRICVNNFRAQDRYFENMKNQNLDYFNRFEYIKDNQGLRKEEIRKQIEECEIMISELHTYTLKVLLEKFRGEDVLSYDVRQNKFLVFLLSKGFINENYADYINYFHPNSITKEEMKYIRGIRIKEAVGEFSYTIRNVEQVCERIEDYEFKQIEALNFDIADYLVTKNEKDKKSEEFFTGLAEGDNTHDEFIREYIKRNIYIDKFINLLCKYYKYFCFKIVNSDLITEESKFYYISLIIEYGDLDDIVLMNEVDETRCLSTYIQDNKQALVKLSKNSSDRMIKVINSLGIIFENIDIDGADISVLNYIFEKNKYVLNSNMLRSLFNFFYSERAKELETSNYTVILETAYKPLLNNIYDNFEEYVSKFVIGQQTNVNESINAVEDILERLIDCNVDLCLSTLEKENIIWDNIENCCICSEERKQERKVIWNYLLRSRTVMESWNNYLGYYKEYKLTSELVEWVDNVIDSLIQDQKTDQITDDIIKEILIKNTSLDAFTKLTENYRVDEFDCNLSEFSSDKIEILIKHNYIPFTIEYFEVMKREEPNQVVDYVINNKEEFLKNITKISVEIDTVSDFIKSGKFVESEVKELLELFDAVEMNQKMAYEIRNLKINLKKSYVEVAWELLEEKDRYQLLLNQLEIYSNDEIASKLATLDDVYKALSDRSRRHKEYVPVDNIGYNENLLNKLKDKKYFTSIEKEEYDEEDIITHKKKRVQRFAVWIKQSNSN